MIAVEEVKMINETRKYWFAYQFQLPAFGSSSSQDGESAIWNLIKNFKSIKLKKYYQSKIC